MTIYDDLKKWRDGIKKHPGEIGLELETEGLKPYDVPNMGFWVPHQDNSLRGPMPMEYTLKQPVRFEKQLDEALNEFHDSVGSKYKFDETSITTSTHVHLNMLPEKWQTFGNFLTTYSLVENVLVRKAGEHRLSNGFCLPICDAEDTFRHMMSVMNSLKARKFSFKLDPDTLKYAALNLAALNRFGSLEQRSFRGTTNMAAVKEWVSILYRILEYSRQDIHPMTIVNGYREKGVEILTDIFKDYRESIRHKSEDNLLDKNFWYAAKLASVIDDWSKVDKEPIKKKPRDEELDKLSLAMFKVRFKDLKPNQAQMVLNASEDDEFREQVEEVAPWGIHELDDIDREEQARRENDEILQRERDRIAAHALGRNDRLAGAFAAPPDPAVAPQPEVNVGRDENGFVRGVNADQANRWFVDPRPVAAPPQLRPRRARNEDF